jgi:hypothetical protein
MKKETIIGLTLVLVLAAAGFVFFMETQRKAKNQENDPYSAEAMAERSGGTPSFFPLYSGIVVVEAGKVASAPAAISGPMLLRVSVHTSQQMNVAIVPKTKAASFSSQEPLGSLMVDLKCANSGKGDINLSCELDPEEKDMVVVLGDPRNGAQALRQSFETKKNSEEIAPYSTGANVSIFAAVPAKK